MDDKKFIWDLEEEKNRKKKLKLQQERQKKLKRKKEIKKKKRRKKIKKFLKKLLMLIIIIIIINLPIISINKIDIKGNFNTTAEEIRQNINLNPKESIISIFYKLLQFKYFNEEYSSINYNYNNNSKTMIINVKEVKALSHTNNGKNYIDNKGIIKISDKNYSTPLLEDFDDKEISIINKELKDVNKKIIIQMQSITYSDKKNNILKIHMYDNNDIFIYPEQISDKMNYYIQMKSILDYNKKPAGNIYLYMGDYYEPK